MEMESMLKNEKIQHLDLRPSVLVEMGTPLKEVIKKMQKHRSTAVLIIEGEHLKGIFTERDVLQKIVGEDVDDTKPIQDFMTADPITLTMDATLKEAIKLMVDGGYRNIPMVGKKDIVKGNLTAHDLINYIVDHFPEEIYNLPPRLHQIAYSPHGA